MEFFSFREGLEFYIHLPVWLRPMPRYYFILVYMVDAAKWLVNSNLPFDHVGKLPNVCRPRIFLVRLNLEPNFATVTFKKIFSLGLEPDCHKNVILMIERI